MKGEGAREREDAEEELNFTSIRWNDDLRVQIRLRRLQWPLVTDTREQKLTHIKTKLGTVYNPDDGWSIQRPS